MPDNVQQCATMCDDVATICNNVVGTIDVDDVHDLVDVDDVNDADDADDVDDALNDVATMSRRCGDDV